MAFSACATKERSAVSRNAASPTPAPTVRATPPATPNAAGQEQSKRAGSGTFNEYKFAYRRAGGEVETTFAPTPLPWNDQIVVGAAREVLVTAYDDKSENFPRAVRWPYQGAQVNAIKLEGEKFEYVFVPVKEDGKDGAKQVRKIAFWQLAKGTAR